MIMNIPGADKSLARPGRKQTRRHVRIARDFSNIETRAIIKFFFCLQCKAPKEIHAILTDTLAFFLLGGAKDLSAPLDMGLLFVLGQAGLLSTFLASSFLQMLSICIASSSDRQATAHSCVRNDLEPSKWPIPLCSSWGRGGGIWLDLRFLTEFQVSVEHSMENIVRKITPLLIAFS